MVVSRVIYEDNRAVCASKQWDISSWDSAALELSIQAELYARTLLSVCEDVGRVCGVSEVELHSIVARTYRLDERVAELQQLEQEGLVRLAERGGTTVYPSELLLASVARRVE